MNEADSDGHSADEPEPAKVAISDELIAQEKLLKRAKKRARDEQEANRLIEAGQGARSAKKKGLQQRVWLNAEGKRQSPRKASNVNLKKSNEDKPKAKEKKTTGGKKATVPISRRSVSPFIEEPKPRKQAQKAVKGKSSRPKPKGKAVPSKRKRSKHSDSSGSSESAASSSDDSELTELTDNDASGTSDVDDGVESEEFDQELSDSGLHDLMESEQPIAVSESSGGTSSQNAVDLFNGMANTDVVVIDHKRGSSSSRSHPPTSDSEDPPSSIQDSWMAIKDDVHESPPQPSQRPQKKSNKGSKVNDMRKSPPQPSQGLHSKPDKKSKASDARAAKFRDERATIVSAAPLPTKSDKRMKSVTEGKASEPLETSHIESDASPGEDWPAHTKVNGQGLLQQNVYIRATCHQAIKIVEKTLLSEHAWPELHRVGDYRIEVLTQATKVLDKAGPQYRDIRRCVKKDDDFAKAIGRWVVDRLSHNRGPVRSSALDHIAVFQLGIDETCVKRVTSLLATDTYVYPGHWETDSRGNPKWVVRGNQIYLNTGIINILRSTFFSSPSALGFRYKDIYCSSHPDRPKHELTIPLVALAATGIHAALDAWKNGNYIKKKSDKFDGETYKTVFNRHVSYLQGLKTKNLNAFHSIMSELHTKIVCVFISLPSHHYQFPMANQFDSGNSGQDGGVAQAQGDALAVLDLSGFD